MKEIKILGTGCPKCNKLAERAETAARKLNVEYRLEKVTDLNKIMEYGVMVTPALVVDGEIKVSGRVPSADVITKMLLG